MYGLIVKLALVPGTREKMSAILKGSATDRQGCISDVVAGAATDPNVLWVTEACDSQANHDGSVSLPAVRNAILHSKEIV
jgi:hypothetical protein